jgi:hypothetical protein
MGQELRPTVARVLTAAAEFAASAAGVLFLIDFIDDLSGTIIAWTRA